jgi:hypothetical protein
MKKSLHLIKLAAKLSNKYADVAAEDIRAQVDSSIWTAVRNASTTQSSGIIPFITMCKKDGVDVSFDVTRDDTWSGSPNITVSNLKVVPSNSAPGVAAPNLTSKYQPLVDQVKAYLERYPELYPTKRSGLDVDYKNYTTHLDYPNEQINAGGDSVATK